MLASMSSSASAAIVTTTFSTADGFSASPAPVTLLSDDGSFSTIFSGGIQRVGFDSASHNDDAYFFINGTFTGNSDSQTGTTDIGTIEFSRGVETVSFFAADRANGTPELRILSPSGQILATRQITSTVNIPGSRPFEFNSASLGSLIGSIEFDNAGPAGNPPYVTAIDSFRASAAAVPEPSSFGVMAGLSLAACLRRRRTRRT